MTLYDGQVVTIGDHFFGLFRLKTEFFMAIDENGKEVKGLRFAPDDSEYTVKKWIAEKRRLEAEFQKDQAEIRSGAE